ncbi:hypothetical protein D3C86_2082530 [compost metagenome]
MAQRSPSTAMERATGQGIEVKSVGGMVSAVLVLSTCLQSASFLEHSLQNESLQGWLRP